MRPRPFVVMNVAVSADGKTDTVTRQGAGISSVLDRERVDRLRAESDAVTLAPALQVQVWSVGARSWAMIRG